MLSCRQCLLLVCLLLERRSLLRCCLLRLLGPKKLRVLERALWPH